MASFHEVNSSFFSPTNRFYVFFFQKNPLGLSAKFLWDFLLNKWCFKSYCIVANFICLFNWTGNVLCVFVNERNFKNITQFETFPYIHRFNANIFIQI